MTVCVAADLGAESGRVVAGTFDGERLALEEVHRFPNVPVRLGGQLVWDLPALLRGVGEGLGAA
ncbi:MAG TPA: rhamnulokinase, partial [Candidatus Binatia bacterium]|nr:rhamnulokinase [Candidatus Binatia bacterium]